jgi:uncharacterized protein
MLPTNKKILFCIIFSILPFLLLIIHDSSTHLITFFILCLSYPISRYWKSINFLHNTIEILFLYFSLSYLINHLKIDIYFPANIIIIICFLYIFLFVFKKLNRATLFFNIGDRKGTLPVVLLFSILSIFSLAFWFLNQDANPYVKFMPDVSLFFLIPMGIGFAVINAFYEESLFRSILLSQFSEQIGLIPAIFLQALWFSFLHFQSGFPSGIVGICLTFVFGLMMGYLVKRTNGLLIPIIIHFLADLSIFILIVLEMKNII